MGVGRTNLPRSCMFCCPSKTAIATTVCFNTPSCNISWNVIKLWTQESEVDIGNRICTLCHCDTFSAQRKNVNGGINVGIGVPSASNQEKLKVGRTFTGGPTMAIYGSIHAIISFTQIRGSSLFSCHALLNTLYPRTKIIAPEKCYKGVQKKNSNTHFIKIP